MIQALERRIPPPVVGAVVAAGMWGAARVAGRLEVAAGARIAVAVALAAAGLALAAAGIGAFRRAGTTANPLTPEAASALVSSGVFRYTRNPMYLGLALVLTGWAAYLAAPVALAGPLLFAAYITRFQVLPEERALAARFGRDFEAYRQAVRRWL